jgi:hypothetical protein
LPSVGTAVCVDRHEHRGWTTILANRIHLNHPESRITISMLGLEATARGRCWPVLTPISSPTIHSGYC